MSDTPVRVLIVDDEPPARRKIARLLEGDPGVAVVGEAGDGRSAVDAIRSLRPEVVFLDIQMPEIDGFGVLEALAPEELPEIVFVTAYDQYAIQAFEVAALDYLLKPFDAPRLREALDRAKARVRNTREAAPGAAGEQGHDAELAERIRSLLAQLDHAAGASSRILVKDRDRARFVSVDEIRWIRGAGNYVEIHAARGTHLLRETLDGIQQRLDPRRFLRVHRSYVVNIDHVREIEPLSHGDHLLVLTDGSEVRLSRRYRSELPDDLLRGL